MKKNNLIPLCLLVILSFFVACETDNENEPEPEPEIDNIHIPDEYFKNALLNDDVVDTNNDGVGDTNADTNDDGEIQRTEAEGIEGLMLHYDYHSIGRYIDLTGIEHFINLTALKMTGEGKYDIIEDPNPQVLLSYDFTALEKLQFLQVNGLGSNYAQALDLSGLTNLVELDLSYNRPTWFDDGDYKIPLNFIDVKMEGLSSLTKMSLVNSFLYVDFCEVPALETLDMRYLEGGEPEEFDFHCLTNLEWLDISENHINTLILKNSSVLHTFIAQDIGTGIYDYMPPVEYVCIDNIQEEWDQISTLIDENSVVTTDCTF